MNLNFYPESPEQLPENLTKPSTGYIRKTTLAVAGIILFFLLYFSLIVLLTYLFYLSIVYSIEDINKLTVILKLGAIAGSGMLLIFTLKFIFRLQSPQTINRVLLNQQDHPLLVKFIEKICQETGADKPKNIYVDPDVNAYVSYNNLWLSMVLPVKKDLTIGLGILNCLNLSEFKAVMAHEFGHFAQKSMKVGSFIYGANTIIHNMIFERDRWDLWLDKWRASDIRLSAGAWIITPVIWLIRQLLKVFYSILNRMYSSLSREMEFNADKVAVKLTGSDAIISALWKLDNGFEEWNTTLNHAYLASQKNLSAIYIR